MPTSYIGSEDINTTLVVDAEQDTYFIAVDKLKRDKYVVLLLIGIMA